MSEWGATTFRRPEDLLFPERIECRGCMLRGWRRADKAALIRLANNIHVWRNLRDLFPHPYTEADADRWLGSMAREPPPPGVYAIDVGGEAVGTISVERQWDIERYSAEVGYRLGEPYWGRGIMTEAVQAVTGMALREPDLCRLFALVLAWNPASMRVLEKAGYEREGVRVRSGIKDGIILDRVLYAITRPPDGPYVTMT
jgi:RimJ/RimL family protein N-acetyltransferase